MSVWREEDHPRGEDGRFVEKIGAVLARGYELPLLYDGRIDVIRLESTYNRIEEKNLHKISLAFFGKGKGNEQEVEIPVPPKNAYGFSSAKRRDTEHHADHAKQMGYKDQKAYQKAAVDFWEHGEGTVYYSIARKNFVKIANDGVTAISITVDGVIQTFLRYTNRKNVARMLIQDGCIEVR